MRRQSLRLRLLAMAFVSTTGALVVSGIGLVILFERHVEQRVDDELETHIRQIAGNIVFSPAGDIAVAREPADPRFGRPLSGLYWQVSDDAHGALARSRSLWDARLALPADDLDTSTVHRHLLPGPGQATLIVRERSVSYAVASGKRTLRIAVAIDGADVRAAAWAFAGDLAPSLALLGTALLAAAWLQVRVGLRPLEAVRRGVGAIRSRARRRLAADYPDEVMPLVEEVNNLLDAQDRTIERARATAGDLAHGLKTPLTALGSDARLLRERGQAEIATDIEDLSETMRRHVERALAQARLRHSRGATTILAPLVERLVETIRRTPSGEPLSWEIGVPFDLRVAVDPDDLVEVLGNLLENAAKWAKGRVRISASTNSATVTILVEDDGRGIPEAARQAVLERGVRLDQTAAGSGLGLAIAGDVLDASGGTLRLDDSVLGGLKAIIVLPSAASPGDDVLGPGPPGNLPQP
jgi:signal transduction histidine kinase